MEFVLNGIRYQISDLEVFVSYIIVDRHFRNSKFNIHFDFLNDFEDNLSFEDLKRGADLIGDLNISFVNPNFRIEQGERFKISYQDISFDGIYVGEAAGVLIALNALIEHRPALSLKTIKKETDDFIAAQRQKFISQ